VIPNVEFRSNVFVGSSSINFHVLFSEKVSIKDIEEKFLHEIDFRYEADPQQADKNRKLKEANFIELGQRLKAEHAEFASKSDVFVGMMNAVVDDNQVTNILLSKESIFGSKYVFVMMADEDLSSIDWDSRDHQTRKLLTQKSDLLFSSNAKTRSWSLGQDPYKEGSEKFIAEFKTLKPCIHGSDAHAYDFIAHPCAKRGVDTHNCVTGSADCELRFCWIKADTTFEGLWQIKLEPSDRVVVQEKDPTPVKSNYTIQKIKISESVIGDELKINETEIELNPFLVAVTGGKGSGKTALVDLLANCYRDRSNVSDSNSFVRRITSDQTPDIEVELTFKDGTTFTKKVADGNFIEHSEIVYIAQGELEDYINDDSDLDDFVNSLIFDSPVIKDTEKSFEFEQLQSEIVLGQKSLKGKNSLVARLEESTSTINIQAVTADKKKVEAEIKDVANRVIESEKVQPIENQLLAQGKQTIIANFKEKKEELLSIQDALRDAISFIDNDLVEFNATVESINALLKKHGNTKQLSLLTYGSKDDLGTINTEIQTQLTKVVKEIEKAQKDIESLESGVKEHAKLLDKQKELEQSLVKLQKKEADLTKDQEVLKKELESREEIYRKLLKDISLLKAKYEEIISVFSSNKDAVLSDLSFSARVNYNQANFEQGAEDLLDQRKIKLSYAKGENSIFLPLFTAIQEYIANGESKIDEVIKQNNAVITEHKDKIKNSQGVSTTIFYDWVYGDYFSVAPTVKYKSTQLHKLSLGQKATVLIKIYLAQGDKPIIIDSHDDHLDNEFIMDELVKAIRQAKQYRQVILASNNGNVVINSDSEQIVIATRKDGEISYVAGSIENPEIHTHAIRVLEGGQEAFKQRQLKYRISE
jgi:energy-coupling factor transporter ATP-binding protein EcfA2